MKTDSLIYRLLQSWPRLVLDLAGLSTIPADGYTLQAVEVKQTAFRLDGVLMPPVLMPPCDLPDRPVVFVEAQWQCDADFYGRWFTEICMYLYRHPPHREWRAVAVFANESADGPIDIAFTTLLQNPWFKRIHLTTALQATDDPPPGLQTLGLLLANPDVVVAEAKGLLSKVTDDWGITTTELVNWVETMLVYKLTNSSRDEIRAMLDIFNVELKHTRFYQEVFAEGMQEGIVKGLLEGLDRGKQEGRQDGEKAMLMRQLQRKFGSLTKKQQAQLDKADADTLLSWSERIFTANTVAEVLSGKAAAS